MFVCTLESQVYSIFSGLTDLLTQAEAAFDAYTGVSETMATVCTQVNDFSEEVAKLPALRIWPTDDECASPDADYKCAEQWCESFAGKRAGDRLCNTTSLMSKVLDEFSKSKACQRTVEASSPQSLAELYVKWVGALQKVHAAHLCSWSFRYQAHLRQLMALQSTDAGFAVFMDADQRQKECAEFSDKFEGFKRRTSKCMTAFPVEADISKEIVAEGFHGNDMVTVHNHTVEYAKLLTQFAKQYICFRGSSDAEEQRALMQEVLATVDVCGTDQLELESTEALNYASVDLCTQMMRAYEVSRRVVNNAVNAASKKAWKDMKKKLETISPTTRPAWKALMLTTKATDCSA